MNKTQTNTWTLLLLFTITHLLLTQNVFSKDIEFDELPKSIQEIALRVIGDVPVDDVDREKDDNEIYYDVEAEDDRIRFELQIKPDGTFIEKDITENISFLEFCEIYAFLIWKQKQFEIRLKYLKFLDKKL